MQAEHSESAVSEVRRYVGDSSEPRHDRSTITALKSRGINVKFVHNPRQALELVVISRVESLFLIVAWSMVVCSQSSREGLPGLTCCMVPLPV